MPGKPPSPCGLGWVETSVRTKSVLLPACHTMHQMHAKGVSHITPAAGSNKGGPQLQPATMTTRGQKLTGPWYAAEGSGGIVDP